MPTDNLGPAPILPSGRPDPLHPIDLTTAHLYLEQYGQHRDTGNSPLNARLHIVGLGCPVTASHAIQDAFGESDQDED